MKSSISRRNFIRKTALTTGMAATIPLGLSGQTSGKPVHSSHEIWIAGVSQMGLRASTPEQMTEKVMEIAKGSLKYQPDFIILPEVFPFEGIEQNLTFQQKVEKSLKVLDLFSAFAKQNGCYLICPVFTSSEGRIYNSAVVFDRSGNKIGQYNKIHETVEYVAQGVSCGDVFQPAIKTEYCTIGIQICYDINFEDGWKMFRDQGVRIIFWPSAFDGGRQISMKALQNKCFIASSTNKNNSRICDINGEVVAQTGIWEPNLYHGKINLEKVFLPTYDYLEQCSVIEKKYGRAVKVTIFHEEEWTIVECVSPELYIKDIIKEFDLIDHTTGLKEAEVIQARSRRKVQM